MNLDSNCIEIILFYGNKERLIEKMSETCDCEHQKANEFIHKYFTFLTKESKPDQPE